MKNLDTPIGYSSLEERKSNGAHYTPAELADFLAQRIFDAWNKKSQKPKIIKILDPAVGDGELILALLRTLFVNNYKNIELHGFDTDKNAINLAKKRILSEFPKIGMNFRNEDFLKFGLVYRQRDLFIEDKDLIFFDLVIANPPYVRTQILGSKESGKLAKKFGLSGRIDLYYAFLVVIGEVLSKGGKAGVITSNRFMTVKSGKCLREKILKDLSLFQIWDFGDTQLFEAAVLPVVLTFGLKEKELKKTEFVSIYSCGEEKEYIECKNIFDAVLNKDGYVDVQGKLYCIRKGYLDTKSLANGDIWRLSCKKSDDWIDIVKKNSFCKFGDIGKVKVGIKTTADKVFIKKNRDWDDMGGNCPELLRPLITHHAARRFKGKPYLKRVLYTHEVVKGKRVVINLLNYSKSSAYLETHRDILEAREYIKEAGREWFEIWVPHNPDFWKKPKVIFRDISERPIFWFDESHAIVNGDCYWICCDNEKNRDLLWLIVAVGNSTFIESYYDNQFNNKLYSGRRRFLTQYVKEFPLPDPESEISLKIIKQVKNLYFDIGNKETKDLEEELDNLIWMSFGLVKKIFR